MPKPHRLHTRDANVPRATQVLRAYLAPLARRGVTELSPREAAEVARRWRNAYGEAPYPERDDEESE